MNKRQKSLFVTLFTVSLITLPLHASDENVVVKNLCNKVEKLEIVVSNQKSVNEQLKREDAELRRKYDAQRALLDSLSKELAETNNNVNQKSSSLNQSIEKNKQELNIVGQDLIGKTYWGIALFVILAFISAIVYMLLSKRTKTNTDSVMALKEKTDKLNEEILNQFSLEMSEIQKLSNSLTTISSTSSSNSGEQDHSLIKTLADRITFMEMTLYKMDSKVRGHKQLSKSINQMKDNLLANGYEIVAMLGKPYNEGIKAVANFVDDEDAEEGIRIITGIIKPQINYKGTMIQSAQITVTQNIQ